MVRVLWKFVSTKDWHNIIWNNKEIHINNSPVFYKNFFDSGIVLASDLLFNLNSTESFNIIKNRVDKTNFLTWAGLRHAVPHEFKNNMMSPIFLPSFVINNDVFDITKKKSKHYYSLLLCDAPYRGRPTNFFYKLANQDTQIWLTVTPPCRVQQASDATTNYWKHVVL